MVTKLNVTPPPQPPHRHTTGCKSSGISLFRINSNTLEWPVTPAPYPPWKMRHFHQLWENSCISTLEFHWVKWWVPITGGSCHKYHFCCNKSFVTANTFVTHIRTKLLSGQNYVCCDKTFITKKYLSQQTRICCDKSFVMTSILLLHQGMCFVTTNMFVMTKACHDKSFVATKWCLSQQIFVMTICLSLQKCVCHNKSLVVTSILLSWQKMCFVMTHVCCDKNDTCGSSRQCQVPCVVSPLSIHTDLLGWLLYHLPHLCCTTVVHRLVSQCVFFGRIPA